MILPDLLKKDLDIVFCGTAAGNVSAELKSYYAGPGNLFYPILHKSGLTPILVKPLNYSELLKYNLGLTDIAKFVSGNDNVLNNEDFDINTFIEKIKKYKPKTVCFNGKTAASVFLYNKKNKTGKIEYGYMQDMIGKTKIYVAPSTSRTGRKYWDEKIWFNLKRKFIKI